MKLVERVDQFFVGRIAFPAVNYVLNRRDILGRCRKLLSTERLSPEALRELQFERLSAVLRHAYRWCPFYTRRFKEVGLAPGDIKTLEDIRRVPPLVRRDVIDHRRDMVDLRYREEVSVAERSSRAAGLPLSFARFRRHKLIRRSSSGSTGTPTVFYEDGSTTALNWVHELRLKHWFEVAPGAKEARMSAASMDYAAERKRKLASAREWLWNQMILPGYFLSDREYELCLRKIRKFRPRVLWGPTRALTGLAQYARSTGADISACRPNLVISRAAPLYEHEKKLLAEVFGCPVTNIYGSKEVGHAAMICPQGSMHVNEENYLVEIDTDSTSYENAGRGPGKLLTTPLFQSPMPFLRYQIGDLAELGGNDCACGRSLVTLKKILGRVGDVFKTKEGHLIEPSFWCMAFEQGRLGQDVEKYQVVYRRDDLIRVRIVPRSGYSPDTEADLRRFLAKNVPSSIQFEFEYVDDIKPQPSGKYLFVVNEIEQREAQAVLD